MVFKNILMEMILFLMVFEATNSYLHFVRNSKRTRGKTWMDSFEFI